MELVVVMVVVVVQLAWEEKQNEASAISQNYFA